MSDENTEKRMNSLCSQMDVSHLKSVELSDKPMFDVCLNADKSKGCDNSFATIFMWSAAYDAKWMNLNGRIIVYFAKQKLLYYPYGAHTEPAELAEILKAFTDAKLLDKDANFIYNLPSDYEKIFPEASNFFDIKNISADHDYIYCVEKLIENSGAKLRKKRNHIKQFVLHCPDFAIEEINDSNIESAKNFMLGQARSYSLWDEAAAMERGFQNFSQLGLSGLLMRCPCDSIAAAAIMSPLGGGAFDVHFEKSMHDVSGASQMIVWQEAVAIKNLGGTLMNREEDMGEENLRRAKESLDPLEKLERKRAYML